MGVKSPRFCKEEVIRELGDSSLMGVKSTKFDWRVSRVELKELQTVTVAGILIEFRSDER